MRVQKGPIRHERGRFFCEKSAPGSIVSAIRLITGALTVGVWTLLSRILGFLRDILIAAYLGTGPVAEAFLVAFSLPNLFRRFFAEGAFNMAFVPLFSKKLEAGDNATGFARDALAGLTLVLLVITVLATIFMPWLVLAMASGFAQDARFDMAVTLGRVVFVYILFISLAALLSGVLNASGRFAAAAAAPVLLNIILIGVLVLAELGLGASIIGDAPGGSFGTALAFGVVLAGIAQLLLVWVAARRAGFDIRLTRPRWTPELKRLAIIAAPAMLAGGVVQINILIGRQVVGIQARHKEGDQAVIFEGWIVKCRQRQTRLFVRDRDWFTDCFDVAGGRRSDCDVHLVTVELEVVDGIKQERGRILINRNHDLSRDGQFGRVAADECDHQRGRLSCV